MEINMPENINLIIQIIAASGVIVSVVYLGIQIHQQNNITRAQFGHSLTQRLYDRYFQTTKDAEFSKFLAKDWSSSDLDNTEKWRVNHFLLMCLVDIFDVYDKVQNNFVDRIHLDMRMNSLRLGVIKTKLGKNVWNFMKTTRSEEFVTWFESEIFDKDDDSFDEVSREELKDLNIIR